MKLYILVQTRFLLFRNPSSILISFPPLTCRNFVHNSESSTDKHMYAKVIVVSSPAGDEDDIEGDINPRSPTAHQVPTIFLPVSPDRRSLFGSVIINTPWHEKERERVCALECIASLVWDYGSKCLGLTGDGCALERNALFYMYSFLR